MKTKQQIIADIKTHMSSVRYWSEIYVGISKDPRDRLFNGHGVDRKRDKWILRRADSSDAARDVEAHFLRLGADGGPGGGDDSADFVYAYKKAPHTTP